MEIMEKKIQERKIQEEDIYHELQKDKTILEWINDWNIINRDVDLCNMEKFMRQPEDLQRNDKMIKRYDKFCEEVKDITTTLCLTCLNITFKDRSTQALIEKYTGKTFIDGALRHQKLKLCKILLDKSSEIQMTLLHDKHGEMTEFEGYGMNRNDIHGALKLINYVRTIIFFKYIYLSTWRSDIRKLDWFKYIKKSNSQ